MPGADVEMQRNLTQQVWNANGMLQSQATNLGSLNTVDYLIEAKDLSKVYSGSQGSVAAVANNNFCVAKGEIFGLLGPNGAGKTSTFNILTLSLQRSQGDCRIAHTDIDVLNIPRQKLTVGMCAQHNTIWEALTVD